MQEALVMQLSALTTGTAQSTASSSTSNSSLNTALVPNFDNFETYHNYILRFTNYVTMKGVGTNKEYCAKLLLNSMSATFFNIASGLAALKAAKELE